MRHGLSNTPSSHPQSAGLVAVKMPIEIEVKFLNADHSQIRRRLRQLGAECTSSCRLMKRRVFDFSDKRLQASAGWVRLRDEGDRITLSYKRLDQRSLSGMRETVLTVDDFAAAESFLAAIGLECYSYQETKRESWRLNGAEIDLDVWPWIRPFIEIEAQSEKAVWQAVEELGLRREDARFGSVEIAYQAEYDVTEAEVDAWPEITFKPVPGWLAAKAKRA